VWEVTGVPAASESAHRAASFVVSAGRAGPIRTPERWTRFWRVASGPGSVREDADGFTEVVARGSGQIRVVAGLTGG
jgi:hypothetical protein